MTDALEMRDRYTYKTYRQEWRVNSVEVDQYDRNPRVYATKSFPTREEAEAHRVEIAKPHTHVEGRWVPNDATHSYVDCYVQFTEVLSEKSIQTSDIDALDALKACVEQMSNDHPGSDTYWQAVEKAESVISNSKAVVRASCQARVEELERALRIAHEGLKAGCDQYAERTFSGQEVPGDEQFPWVRKMQIGRDATLRALADRKEGDA